METIEQLQTRMKEISDEQLKIRRKINKINFSKKFPHLKSKYEGKFFKYFNSYGDKSDSWWMYIHCLKIKDEWWTVCNIFKTNPVKHEFSIKVDIPYDHLQIEIIETEYILALKEFINKLNELLCKY